MQFTKMRKYFERKLCKTNLDVYNDFVIATKLLQISQIYIILIFFCLSSIIRTKSSCPHNLYYCIHERCHKKSGKTFVIALHENRHDYYFNTDTFAMRKLR